MDEQVRHLIDELERFVVLQDDLLLVLLLVLFPLLIRLPLINLELLALGMFAQPQQELGLFLEEFEQFNVMVFHVKQWCSLDCLSALVDKFDQGIDGFACLDGHVLVLLQQEVVQLVEQVYVVF